MHKITPINGTPLSSFLVSIITFSDYANNLRSVRHNVGGRRRSLGDGKALVWAASAAYLCAHGGVRCGRSQHPEPTEPEVPRLSLAPSAARSGLILADFFSLQCLFFSQLLKFLNRLGDLCSVYVGGYPVVMGKKGHKLFQRSFPIARLHWLSVKTGW